MEKKSYGNRVGWFDIPATNLDRAMNFYTQVLAIEIKKESMGEHSMGIMSHGEGDVAGCLYVANKSENSPSDHGILLYFNAEGRLEEAEAKTPQWGGKVLQAKHPIGPFGFRVILLDSEGNRIALHSMK